MRMYVYYISKLYIYIISSIHTYFPTKSKFIVPWAQIWGCQITMELRTDLLMSSGASLQDFAKSLPLFEHCQVCVQMQTRSL